jgi:hypothetical protein
LQRLESQRFSDQQIKDKKGDKYLIPIRSPKERETKQIFTLSNNLLDSGLELV